MWFTQSLGYVHQTMSQILLRSNDYNLITIYNPLQLNTAARSNYHITPFMKIPNPKHFYTSIFATLGLKLVTKCWHKNYGVSIVLP